MGTQINKFSRFELVGKIVSAKFANERAAIDKVSDGLAHRIVKSNLTPGGSAGEHLLANIPPNWLLEVDGIYVRFTNGDGIRVHFKEPHRIPAYMEEITIVDPPLRKAIKALSRKQRAMNLKQRDFKKVVKDTLEGFRTYESLLKAWPEITSLVPTMAAYRHPVKRQTVPKIVPPELRAIKV